MAENKIYPRFYKQENGPDLFAFLAKDRLFHLRFSGNRGDGFEFRIYKTRKAVLNHERNYGEISFAEFKLKLSQVLQDHIKQIEILLPKLFLN